MKLTSRSVNCYFYISGRHKCREVWPGRRSEGAYIIFLDIVLLMIPLLIMSLAYSLIVLKLWKGLQRELKHSNSCLQTGKFDLVILLIMQFFFYFVINFVINQSIKRVIFNEFKNFRDILWQLFKVKMLNERNSYVDQL